MAQETYQFGYMSMFIIIKAQLSMIDLAIVSWQAKAKGKDVVQAVTPRSLETFAESANQLVNTPPDRKMAKVTAYARSMGERSIITVPMDIELFSTEMAIYLEHNDFERFIGR